MPKDYEVFEPINEHIARIIVGILEEKEYIASYQIGYPRNKIFVTVDTKEEADRISGIISKFIEKLSLTEGGLTTDRLEKALSKLRRQIPKTSKSDRLLLSF
jgi:hypothetical protein